MPVKTITKQSAWPWTKLHKCKCLPRSMLAKAQFNSRTPTTIVCILFLSAGEIVGRSRSARLNSTSLMISSRVNFMVVSIAILTSSWRKTDNVTSIYSGIASWFDCHEWNRITPLIFPSSIDPAGEWISPEVTDIIGLSVSEHRQKTVLNRKKKGQERLAVFQNWGDIDFNV